LLLFRSAVTRNDPKALIRYALAAFVATLAIAWTLVLARDALLIIYISALVAIGLSPLVDAAFQRSTRLPFRIPRAAAVLAVYFAIVGILVGVGMLVIPPLVQQARDLWANRLSLVEKARESLLEWGVLTPNVSIGEAIKQVPVNGTTDVVGTLLGAIWGFVGGVFGTVTILILSFYMLVDSQPLVRAFVRLFPFAERARVNDACRRITAKVSAWLGGQLVLAAVIGTTAAIGLWALGVPYFYVLALIAAIGEMIPVVGPLLAAVPAVLVALAASPGLAVTVALFFFLQQQFENHVLVPRVMSRQVGVSPVVVISALLVGGTLLGVVGAILALPTAAILQVLFEEWAVEEPANQQLHLG
jgi:predicted PurR-regulated permease PerM